MKNQKHTDAKPKSQTMAKQNINNKKKIRKTTAKKTKRTNRENIPMKRRNSLAAAGLGLYLICR